MNDIKKLITLSLVFIALFQISANAQEQMSIRDRAYAMYISQEYAKAIEFYNKIYESGKLVDEEILAIANSYNAINNYEKAEEWYGLYLENEKNQEVEWNYAHVLKTLGRYEDAKIAFEEYGNQYESTADVRNEIAACDSAMTWIQDPTSHLIKNEQGINTALSEFAILPLGEAVLYAGEPSVIQGEKSGRTGNAFLKIFSASIDQDRISLKYPDIVTESFNDGQYHVGPIATNKDEDVFYVTRTHVNRDYAKLKEHGLNFRKRNLEIIIYSKQNDMWVAEPFPYNNTKEYSVGHASLSADEDALYFASDMPGGKGGTDIWVSNRNSDGTWDPPVNVPGDVNTEGDEMFPSVLHDTLYFSSNGHIGMGGLDIFKAVKEGSRFAQIQNMRYPINSSTDDFAYVVTRDDEDIQVGYLSSNRPGGEGDDDIYSYAFKKPKYEITLIGKVYDKATNELLDDVDIQLIKTQETRDSTFVAVNGGFEAVLTKNTAYAVHASKSGHMADSVSIAPLSPQGDSTVYASLYLQPINKKGITFVLENIYYDFDKFDIRPDAALVLNQLVRVLKDNPTLRIELSSHTDSRGSDSYNMSLSEKRAKSAVEYIVQQGIDADRLVSKGYGETRLLNKCSNGVQCSEEEHQQNRRTEIEVLEY